MLSAFVLLIIFCRMRQKTEKGTDILIRAIMMWNVWSFCLVEGLSAAKMLSTAGIIAGWMIFDVLLLAGAAWNRAVRKEEALEKLCFADLKAQLWQNMLPVLAAAIVIFLASVTVPYNWDSMTYHLPRLAHWAQNRSAAHFAANDIRQISSPVLAEFINVQVYILSGRRDNWLNLLQACSYIVDALLVYGIAVRIQCRERFARVAVLLFMTMPIAFGEALNTQVDLFSTIWLLMFVYCFIDVYEMDRITACRRTITGCVMMGFCISFGYMAKPSVVVGMAVLLLFLLVRCVKGKEPLWELLKILFWVIPAVFLPLLPEWIRNYHTFAALGEPTAGARQLVGTLKPNYLLVNLIKNFAQNWSNIYLYDSDEWMAKIVMLIAVLLRVDINDPGIAEDGMEYVMQAAPSYNHDTATNPVTVILATFCFGWGVFHMLKRKDKRPGNRYTVWAMALFVVFCGVVRWESFVNRYMLSYLALLCPMIGWQIQLISGESKCEKLKKAVLPIVYFLCVTELISLSRYHQELWHENASVRPDGYFAMNKEIKQEYLDTIGWVNNAGYKNIGLKLSGINFEYPIWYMLKDSGVRIEQILVENDSAIYEDVSYIPDCILGDAHLGGDSGRILVHGMTYQKEEQFIENRRMAVYLPAGLYD